MVRSLSPNTVILVRTWYVAEVDSLMPLGVMGAHAQLAAAVKKLAPSHE